MTAKLIWERPRDGCYVAKSAEGYVMEASAVQSDPGNRKHKVVLRLISPGGKQLRIRRVEVPDAAAAKAELMTMLADHRRRVAEKRRKDWAKQMLEDSAADGE